VSGRVSTQVFLRTMSTLASGVTVLMVKDRGGAPFGMTASAVTSLSLEPPMLLVCIDHQAAIHQLVVSSERFGINVLAADQADVAVRFADRARHHNRDHRGALSPAGLPLIPGALVHIDVRKDAVYEGGDHSIVTGVLEWSQTRDDGTPLVYWRSRYSGLP
jgi:flavin reductase (DIM6/NTAB) family NADH-FMN oxidoreductase RutF